MSSVLRDPNLFSLDRANRDEIALFLAKAALAAGPAVMEEYERGCSVASKEDGSPVTSADQRAEVIICEYLARLAPMPPVCAEELMAAGAKVQVAGRFLLVDPLDGTREFLAGNGEFTINVALIERGAPVAGAVYAPAIGRLWVGGETAFTCDAPVGAALPGEGTLRRIRTRSAPISLVAFASRSHLNSRVGFFPQKVADRRDALCGFIAEILPHRRGPWRCLPAVRANDGMGHGGGRRGFARGRRRRFRSFRTAAVLRQSRRQIAQRPLYRLG